MNWADSQIVEYNEQSKEQRPFGSRITLLFGLTMLSFFVVTYMTINNFAFRALCVRYLFSPLPWFVVAIGYVCCIAYLLLAFYSFLVYFRIARPVGKNLNLMQLTRLGLPIPASKRSSGVERTSGSKTKTLLPLPGWAMDVSDAPSIGSTPSTPNGARSPGGSMRVSMSARKGTKSANSPTSPKGKSKTQSPSHNAPTSSFSWINSSQTPSRLSTPLHYPKSIASPSAATSRPLSPSSNGSYSTSKAFPKMESPMVKRYADEAEGVIYATTNSSSPFASPAHHLTSPARHYASPSSYHTPGPTMTPRRGTPSAKSPMAENQNILMSPSYTSPRATASFSIENYTTSMSPLSREQSSAKSGKYAPSQDFSFSDETQLDEYVERQRRIETTKEYLQTEQQQNASRAMIRNLKMPVYQSMAMRKSSDEPSSSKEGAYNDDRLAMSLYSKEGVAPHMDHWSENMRNWLSYAVLKPLIKWFDEVAEHMGKDALVQAQLSQVQSGVAKLQSQNASIFAVRPTLAPVAGGIGGATSGLGLGFGLGQRTLGGASGASTLGGATAAGAASTQQQQQKQLEQRIRLERLFGDFGASREYVVERIKTLAQGAVLQAYNWCAGGKWKDKEWSTDLPTDAHLLCHLFCTHLDERVVPTDAAHLHDAFRSRYFVAKDASEDRKTPPFAIVQKSVNPPHYNIVVNGVEWNVLKGRNNLFDALCLFVYVIKRDYKGVLDQRYLGGPIKLLQVLSTEEE